MMSVCQTLDPLAREPRLDHLGQGWKKIRLLSSKVSMVSCGMVSMVKLCVRVELKRRKKVFFPVIFVLFPTDSRKQKSHNL